MCHEDADLFQGREGEVGQGQLLGHPYPHLLLATDTQVMVHWDYQQTVGPWAAFSQGKPRPN